MKIRDKLLLGFGFYILFAVVCGFIAYKDLRKISTRLNLVEVADDLTNTILEVRRYEKNYLLFKNNESLLEFRRYLAILKRNIENIRSEIFKEAGSSDYGTVKSAIAEYELLFDRLVSNYHAQEDLSDLVRVSGRNIEQELSGNKLKTFLVLRRHEKNLMLYKDDASLKVFIEVYRDLKNEPLTQEYASLLNRLFTLYNDEKRSTEQMRLKAREIQSFTENLAKKERAEISSILLMSINVVVFTLISIIVLGAIINTKLATSISRPIRRLEKITKKVAMGDFSESIEVTGKDEISSLEISFNQMEEKLKNVMASLEATIEKLQEKQAQLVEAEKLASIGKLAAGIAHEINNPLTSVLTFSSLMLEATPESDPRQARLKMIVSETTRARNIVRQVLNFAKEAPLKKIRISINRPVEEILDSLMAQEAFKDIDLKVDLGKGLPEIMIDPVQIGQVVLNMTLNAVHAISPPGKIEVSTRLKDNRIEVLFADTGSGISEENLKKIFDPFFTTKDKSKGTGLGLAVSYGIIKKHGGDIEVKSAIGKGTTFIVRLPENG